MQGAPTGKEETLRDMRRAGNGSDDGKPRAGGSIRAGGEGNGVIRSMQRRRWRREGSGIVGHGRGSKSEAGRALFGDLCLLLLALLSDLPCFGEKRRERLQHSRRLIGWRTVGLN